jgi:type 1 glutamine amidotransferase
VTVSGKHILIVLGGTWHDFDGFVATMKPVFEAAGHTVESTYDLDILTCLDEGRYDVVLLHTCLGAPGEDDAEPLAHPDAQAEALVEWVRSGGALLASHAATVSAQSGPALKTLMGGVFVSHPPQFAFTVYPLFGEHPIRDGIAAFTVYDEFYVESYEPSVDVHMVALDRGVAHPMVWSKHEGQGRVAHVAIGHDVKVWSLEPYQRLMLQAIDWLTAD